MEKIRRPATTVELDMMAKETLAFPSNSSRNQTDNELRIANS